VSQIRGVLSAAVTPFTGPDSDLDEPGLRELIERTIQAGAHGLVPCGSTGEFAAMSMDERKAVVEVVLDQAAARVPVIAHVGAMTTRDAILLARHAEERGAAAVMAVAPYYEPLSVGEVKHYFRAVADAVAIPVVLYNLPVATGVNLMPDDVADLARGTGNIRYVKDTTGDLSQAARLIHDYGDLVETFVGWDTLFFAALLEGAAGSIVGAANFAAPQLRAVYDAIQAEDLLAARAEWLRIFPVMQFLMSGGYVAAVRAALDILGYPAGLARAPIEELEPARRAELEALVKSLAAPPDAARFPA
jgi:4-hydroxy-tetrahydrodipicolinate synthase